MSKSEAIYIAKISDGIVPVSLDQALIEQDEDETPFILTLTREDPALIRSLVILAICEAREKAERARDPKMWCSSASMRGADLKRSCSLEGA